MVLSCQQKNRYSLPLWRCFHQSLECIFKLKQPHQQSMCGAHGGKACSSGPLHFKVWLCCPDVVSAMKLFRDCLCHREWLHSRFCPSRGSAHPGAYQRESWVIVSQHLIILLSHFDPELAVGADPWPLQLNFSFCLILFLPFHFHRYWSKKHFLINILNTKLCKTHLNTDFSIMLPHSGYNCWLKWIPSHRIKKKNSNYNYIHLNYNSSSGTINFLILYISRLNCTIVHKQHLLYETVIVGGEENK